MSRAFGLAKGFALGIAVPWLLLACVHVPDPPCDPIPDPGPFDAWVWEEGVGWIVADREACPEPAP